jgi:hypothetical protein
MFHCVRWFPCQLLGLLHLQDILKMEHALHMGYREKTRFFTYLQQTRKVKRRMLFYTMIHGMSIGSLKMSDLKSYYRTTQTLCISPTKCFLYGMGTIVCKPRCLTSTSCTTMSHHGQHIFVDLILLNTSHRLVKLFTTMTNLNKYIFFVCFMNLLFFCFFPMFHFSS